MNILQINSSALVEGSVSTRLANEIATRLLAAHAGSQLKVRNLSLAPVSPMDDEALQALMLSEEARTERQRARVAEYDELIAEIKAADVLVLGVPMYNFGVTSQLKNWIDAICRAGVTFRYTETGPVGLLSDSKKVYVALSRGGIHREAPSDTQVPYLRTVLGFLGMTDVQFVYAEGLAYGDDMAARALSAAHAEIAALV